MRFSLALPILILGCQGTISSPKGPSGVRTVPEGALPVSISALCQQASLTVGGAPLRRMTRVEYNNTVRDLLGDTTKPADSFPAENVGLGFDNEAQSMVVSGLLAEKLVEIAESLATNAPSKYVGTCAKNDDACVKQFVKDFGLRAFRRPLTDVEVTKFYDLYSLATTQGLDASQGMRTVISGMLVSPYFLYRVELGGALISDRAQHLTPWERASRLSYLLWNSMPDDALFRAAAEGKLETPTDILAQAQRMLLVSKTKEQVANFHEQWLQMKKIDHAVKDATLFPEFDNLRPIFKEEMSRFVENSFWSDATLKSLLTSTKSFANKTLADFYEIKGPASSTFESVDLVGSGRVGLLSRPSFLSSFASATETSPIHRGKFVREKLLCQPVGAPPDNVSTADIHMSTAKTMREKLAFHRQAGSNCLGCHQLMDPIGLGFEAFDSVGRHRTLEAGLPVDTHGEILFAPKDIQKTSFEGLEELSNILSESPTVRNCTAKQWFRWAGGRGETTEDVCSLERLSLAFEKSGGNLQQLLVDLTQTDAFLYRTSRVAEGGER